MKRLVFSREARRTLDRMPVNIANRIRAKLADYAADPTAFRNVVKALKGDNRVLRMRIGDWRVLFTETGEIVSIVKVAPRSSAYQSRS